MRSTEKFRTSARKAFRLLTFRLSRDEIAGFDRSDLIFGLLCTWVVGMGRWWDDPGANVLQHLGLGSVIYIFVLAAILWFVVRPFGSSGWTYRNVLIFVSLTSPPAILYAIPVERFTDLATARTINVWFLAAVALWRLAMLVFYLRRFARLTYFAAVVSTLLPVIVIVVTLTLLNLERAVFEIMGGLRDNGTASDEAYAVLVVLTLLSLYLVVPVFVAYLLSIVFSKRPEDEEAR
jgi:hypothetical protein